MEEKKCYKKVYKKVGEGLYKKEKTETQCKPKKVRCEGGVLKYDDAKTGRKAGDPCKDNGRYE